MQPAATLRVLVDVDQAKAAKDLTRFNNTLIAQHKALAATQKTSQQRSDDYVKSLGLTAKRSKEVAKSQDLASKAIDRTTTSAENAEGVFSRLTTTIRRHHDDLIDTRGEYVRTSNDVRSLGLRMLGTTKSAGLMQRAFELIKIDALLGAVGPAAEGLSGLAAGAVSLVSALKPLSGLLTAYGTALTTFAQVKGVTALAGIDNITTAVGGLNEKLDQSSTEFKKLSPEAQKFAKTLNQTKAPLRDVQAAVQKPLFEGLSKGLKEARENMPALEKVLGGTADTLGKLAERAGKFVGSKGFGRDFTKIAETNNQALSRFGRVGINLGHALMDVLVVARPLTDWLTKMALGWSKATKEAAAQGRESGKMADFFEKTKDVVGDLIGIGRSLGRVLDEIFKAAEPLGTEIIDKLRIGARHLAEFFESAEGHHELEDFFHDAKPVLMETGKLIADITKAFFHLRSESHGLFADTLKRFRTELLPDLVDVAEHAQEVFTPRVIDLFFSAAEAFTRIAGTTTPLNIWVDAMTGLLEVFTWLVDNIPGLQTVITTLLGFRAVSSAMNFTAAITGLKGLNTWLGRVGVTAGTTAAEVTAANASMRTTAVGPSMTTVAGAGKAGFGSRFLGAAGGLPGIAAIGGVFNTLAQEGDDKATAAGGQLAGALIGGLVGGIPGAMVGSGIGSVVGGSASDIFAEHPKPLEAAGKKASDIIAKGMADGFGDIDPKKLQQAVGAPAQAAADEGARLDEAKARAFNLTGTDRTGPIEARQKGEGKRLTEITKGWIQDLIDQYGSLRAAGAHMSKDQRQVLLNQIAFASQQGGNLTGVWQHAMDAWDHPKKRYEKNLREVTDVTNKTMKELHHIVGEGSARVSKDYEGMVEVSTGPIDLISSHIKRAMKGGSDVTDKETDRQMKTRSMGAIQADQQGKKIAKDTDKNLGDAAKKGGKHTGDLRKKGSDDYTSLASIAGASTGKTAKDTDRDMGEAERTGTKHADDFKKGAGGSYRSLNSIVHDALFKVQDNTNKALKALGLDPISFGLGMATQATAEAVGSGANTGGGGGGGHGPHGHRQGGGMIAGIGSGDKVPILAEPGEVMLNREAVAAMGGPDRVNLLNRIFPRFGKLRMQPGGIVGIPSFPGEFIDRRILPDVERLTQSYKQFVSDGYAPTGHAAGGEHPLGLATDLVPWTARGGTWDDTDRLAHYAEPVQNQPIDPWRWVGYNGDVDHGRGNHLHLSWQHGPGFPAEWVKTLGGRAIGAVDADVRRVLIKGPGGPLRDIAQAATDKVRDAARRMVRRKSQTAVGDLPMGGAVANLPSGVLSRADIRQLLGAYGMPDIMGYTAYAESGFDPNAGNGSYEGLWALGSPFWTQFAPPGSGDWASNVHDPNKNAAVAARGHDSLGMQPWEASRNAGGGGGWGQYLGQPFQRGGIVGMQGGGIFGKVPGVNPVWSGGTGGGGGHGGRHGGRHHGGGGRGGKGNLFSFSLDAFLGRLGSLKSADRRKETIDRALRLIRSADGSGLTADGSELGGPLADLLAKADEFADYAGRAASLDDPDHPNTFRVRGKTTGGWLTDELDVLWTLRNRLLDAQAVIQKQRKRLLKLIHQASRRLRAAQRRVTEIKKKLDKPGKTPKNWKGPNPAKDTVEAWNRIKDKDRAKQGAKFLRQGGVLPGDRQFREDFSIATPESQPAAFPNLKGVRHQVAGLKALAPALATQRGVVDTGHTTLRDALSEVQGFGPHDRKIKLGESELGVFGGRILDVQIALRDLNIKPEASDTGEGRDALTIAALREFAEAVQLGAFRGASFMGAFAGGGVALVGEQGPELAHMPSGTRIHSATDTEQMMNPNITLFADIYIGGEKVEEKVEVKLRDQDRREFTAARAGRRRGL